MHPDSKLATTENDKSIKRTQRQFIADIISSTHNIMAKAEKQYMIDKHSSIVPYTKSGKPKN